MFEHTCRARAKLSLKDNLKGLDLHKCRSGEFKEAEVARNHESSPVREGRAEVGILRALARRVCLLVPMQDYKYTDYVHSLSVPVCIVTRRLLDVHLNPRNLSLTLSAQNLDVWAFAFCTSSIFSRS